MTTCEPFSGFSRLWTGDVAGSSSSLKCAPLLVETPVHSFPGSPQPSRRTPSSPPVNRPTIRVHAVRHLRTRSSLGRLMISAVSWAPDRTAVSRPAVPAGLPPCGVAARHPFTADPAGRAWEATAGTAYPRRGADAAAATTRTRWRGCAGPPFGNAPGRAAITHPGSRNRSRDRIPEYRSLMRCPHTPVEISALVHIRQVSQLSSESHVDVPIVQATAGAWRV